MADQHNANIPALANQIANDVPDIKENLEFHKDAFQQLCSGWSDTAATGLRIDGRLKDYSEDVNALGDITTSTVDLEDGNVVTATVTSAATLTFSNPPASGQNGGFKLFMTNGGVGPVTWPTSVDWGGGTAPTLTSSGADVLVFETNDGGTIWFGFLVDSDMK